MSDVPTFRESTLRTFADVKAKFATHEDLMIASLQSSRVLERNRKMAKEIEN
jgi:hypothetical protein